MPSAMNAALGALSAERSGSGSALITAVRQVGATIGVAILGTVVATATPAGSRARAASTAAAAARSSVVGGVAVADKLGSAALLGVVRTAFIHGMDLMLWTCGGIALASALLALAFLPSRTGPGQAAADAGPDTPVKADPVAVSPAAVAGTIGK